MIAFIALYTITGVVLTWCVFRDLDKQEERAERLWTERAAYDKAKGKVIKGTFSELLKPGLATMFNDAFEGKDKFPKDVEPLYPGEMYFTEEFWKERGK